MTRFRLNGRVISTVVRPSATLLPWLRSEGLVGTKEGCAEGDCGACTVLVRDGRRLRTVNSCLQLVAALEGLEVWTIEGLGGDHPAQRALVEALGSQCGYCTPGFVMSLVEACHRDDLGAAELDDQICGNLCRCTGYRPIREALRAVAGTHPADGLEGETAVMERTSSFEIDGERFEQPRSLPALWSVLDAYPDHRLVSGGTDLGLEVNREGRSWPCLVSLEAVPELRVLEVEFGGFRVGACVRLTDLEAWAAPELPVLARSLRYFASRQIKHRATVGGNLCNASPIGDLAPVLMALDAVVVLGNAAGARHVPISKFFLGYRQTELRAGEVLLRVDIPRPDPRARLAAYKVSKRRELDISAVSAGFNVVVEDQVVRSARVAFGGMAATTRRAHRFEEALVGRPWTEDRVLASAEVLREDFSPISDHRGSAWYRETVARNLALGFFLETIEERVPTLPVGHSGTVVP
ncbi:MAG TPA: FAD binding domain-containing protein [Myxococcota bacterium]|nr:FAD binding domain-containing protein [Myxococcota bacterium]